MTTAVDYGPSSYGLDATRAVLVFGLGESGVAVVRALRAAGVLVWAWDDGLTRLPNDLSDVPLVPPAQLDWQKVQAVVKAPGIPLVAALVQAAVAHGVPVLGELDVLWRREQASGAVWLGVTGTNGKSTVTALVAHVLQAAGKTAVAGGNLGVAGLALPRVGKGGFYVLELSSYMLEMQRELAVDGGIWLNLTPDHLARHGTMAAYYAAKARLFATAKPEATLVVGDANLVAGRFGSLAEVGVSPALAQAVHVAGRLPDGAPDLPNLPGPHNAQNVACAYALLVPRWLDAAAFWRGVQSFLPLPHRLQEVAVVQGVRLVNDSKATNGDSAVPALRSYPHIYWICGGQAKTDGLGATLDALAAVRGVFTVGQSGPAFAAELRGKGLPVTECGTVAVAVRAAFAAAVADGLPGATVLLSPAAASWDQFASFAHRGEAFVQAVRALEAGA
jgi:UDP-N-acetylmuramoylalanine--D-glutamate ligase